LPAEATASLTVGNDDQIRDQAGKVGWGHCLQVLAGSPGAIQLAASRRKVFTRFETGCCQELGAPGFELFLAIHSQQGRAQPHLLL
jgi:hypothetical protein